MVNFYEIDRFVGKQVQIEIWQETSLIQLLDWLKSQNRNVENFYEHFNCEGYENPLYPVYVSVDGDFDWLYETEPTDGFKVLHLSDIVFDDFRVRVELSYLQHKYNRLENDSMDIVKSWCDLSEFKEEIKDKSLSFVEKYSSQFKIGQDFNKNKAEEVLVKFWEVIEKLEKDREWLDEEYYRR